MTMNTRHMGVASATKQCVMFGTAQSGSRCVGDGAIALLLDGTRLVLSQHSYLRTDIGSIWRKVTDQQTLHRTTLHMQSNA